MSAKVIVVGPANTTRNLQPAIPGVWPRLDRPPLSQFPKRPPFSTAPAGHFNPGARWLEFHLDGPWFKKQNRRFHG